MRSGIKTCILALLVVATVFSVQASAGWKPQVVLGPGTGPAHAEEPYYQSWHRSLSADTLYILTGFYYVDSLYSISIEPGTVVMGDSTATLVVQRGAEIHAQGTPEKPIVFTSMKEPGYRDAGDWGGVIILGEAPVNRVNPVIEGGLLDGYFGGNDPNDDSGEFTYCRIEFPGHRIVEGNEVNGLTMGGVGSETEIHHVQVSYSNDDSFEWFGGNADSDYLCVLGGLDDVFDCDYGHTGRHQFCFALRDPDYSDLEGTANGFECDSYKPSGLTPPITDPTFSNVTMIGPEYNDSMVGNLPPGHAFGYSGVIRRAARTSVFNSVIMGFPYGLSIRDTETHDAANADMMNFHYTSIQASDTPDTVTSVHEISRWADVTTWFNNEDGAVASHSQTRMPSAVGLEDMSDFTNPDPRPTLTSELVTTPADWTHAEVSDGYFTPVTYRGAFAPTVPMSEQWTAGWTNFDPQWTDYDLDMAGVEETIVEGRSLSQNYPNPFNPVTKIAYSIRQAGPVTIKVVNAAGKVVRTLLDSELDSGTSGVVTWDGMDEAGMQCASGVYFYSIESADGTESHKMVMMK
jgi:hypothetical protein